MKAGSLEIEILTNLAKVQAEMAEIKRVVGSTIDGVGFGMDKARASSERYLATLEAQAAKFGKSADEIRKMEVAANAAAAEAKGFQDLADKIRAAGAAIEEAKADEAALAAEQAKAARAAQEAAEAHASYARQLSALRASVDPLAAEEAALRQQIGLVATAMNNGDMEAEEFARTLQVLEGRLEQVKAAQSGATTGMGRLGQQAGLTRGHMMNLGYQLNDVVVSLASGQRPMMVFMQQGSQIAQIGAQAGVGLGGMARGVAAMALNFAKAHPVLLGVAAAAGAATVGFSLLGDKLGKDNHLDAYAKQLGLTKEQIEKAGGATVTFGDMMQGLWKTINDGLGVGKTFASIKAWATDAFITVLKFGKDSAVGIYAYYAAMFDTMKVLWKTFPAVLGDAFISATNLAIVGINKLLDATANGINAVTQKMNAVLGTHINPIFAPQIEPLKNKYAGAGAAVADAFMSSLTSHYAKGQAAADRLLGTLTNNVVNASRARLRAASDQASASHRAAGAAGEHAAAVSKEADALAELLKSTDKQIADLVGQAAAQENVNAMVAAGLITASQAAEAVKKENALRPIAAAMAKAQGQALAELTQRYIALGMAMDRAAAADAEKQALAARDDARAEVERLKLEVSLLGKSNEEREIALAQYDIERKYAGASAKTLAELKQLAADRIHLQHQESDAQAEGNKQLQQQVDLLEMLDQRARVVADALSEAFGRPGDALGRLLTDFTSYAKQREEMELRLKEIADKQGQDSQAYQDARMKADTEAANLEVAHYGNILSAARGFFKEGSTGYKIMTDLEKAYAALQLINTIRAMAMDKVQTASSVTNSMVRGSADAAAGAAKIFSMTGPLGFPIVAAMVGVLAAMGLRGLSGGGGGPKIPTADEVQKAQGTGSVLGDSSAKSDSIAKSLALVEAHTNKDLEYSSQMASSLRAIESNMGSLASLIARQVGVSGGSFDTSGLGLGSKTGLGMSGYGGIAASLGVWGFFGGPVGALGTLLIPVIKKIPIIGDIVGGLLNTLFGTKKTVTLIDQGFEFAAQSVGQIVNSGVIGDIYNALQTTKKSKFFGISTGTKTSYSTQTSPLDSGFTDQIQLLIASLRDGVVGAAKVIGIDGAEAMIDAFQLNLGKISLKDLKGQDLEDAIQAVFSKAADDMAGAVAGGLAEFQKVGEGLFETLTRLARDYQVVDVTLQSIGKSLGAVGVASVGMRENLIDLFGGLDNFTSLTGQFAESFLTEAERMAPVQAAVAKAMADLGLAGVTTKDAFKATVLGLDLTTEAGQQMYAQLLTIAPAFAKVQDYLAKLNPTLEDTAKTAEQLAEIAKQRRSLEIQLLEAQGRSEEALAAKRADELAAIDESNRALQQQVWAAQDAADAAKALADAQAEQARAAEAVAGKRRDLEIQLMEAQGDAAGALAARRADELAAMDESLRALQQQVWAAQDAAAANAALNEVHQTAAELAKTQRELEIRLMEAQGDSAGALAAKRQDEMAAMDSSLRPLLQMIYAAEDLATAAAEAAKAQEEAAARAKSIRELEIRLMDAQGDSAGVLAARRADELAAATGQEQALLREIYAAEDAANANKALADAQAAAAEEASKRADLEIQLLQATGQAAEATARQRALELAAMSEGLRGLQQEVWAAQDAAAAAEALAQAQERAAQAAKELADKQAELQIALLRAQGRELDAVNMERERELASLDESLRALQQQVWAAQDLAAAQAEAARAAEAAAAAERELSDQRTGLEVRLLRAQGNELAAVALERQHELEALDPTLRALQEQVWAAEDAKAAQDALNKSYGDFADIAKQRTQLEIELLRAQGNEAEATARERAAALADLDPSLRALQQAVWAAQDASAAAAKAAQDQAAAQELANKTRSLEIDLLKAMGDEIGATAASRQLELEALDASQRALQRRIWATEDLKAAYDRESAALGDTISKFGDFGKSLREFRASLADTAARTPDEAYRLAQARFVDTAAAARIGDATALGSLQGVSQAFLEASKANAGSLLDYQRDVARVANAVDKGIFASDQAVDYAQEQLAALNKSVDGLLVLNQSVLSVHDAILALAAAGGVQGLAVPSSAYVSAPAAPAASNSDVVGELQAQGQRHDVQITTVAETLKKIEQKLDRWDRGSAMAITPDDDTLPVTVS